MVLISVYTHTVLLFLQECSACSLIPYSAISFFHRFQYKNGHCSHQFFCQDDEAQKKDLNLDLKKTLILTLAMSLTMMAHVGHNEDEFACKQRRKEHFKIYVRPIKKSFGSWLGWGSLKVLEIFVWKLKVLEIFVWKLIPDHKYIKVLPPWIWCHKIGMEQRGLVVTCYELGDSVEGLLHVQMQNHWDWKSIISTNVVFSPS